MCVEILPLPIMIIIPFELEEVQIVNLLDSYWLIDRLCQNLKEYFEEHYLCI